MNRYEMILVTVNTLVLIAAPFAYKMATAYFGKYMEEKARNLATKEDFQELLKQVRETTAATEDIKRKISGGLWLDQELWKARLSVCATLLQQFRTLLWRTGEALSKATPAERALTFLKSVVEALGKEEFLHARAEADLLLRPKLARGFEELRRSLTSLTENDWEDANVTDRLGLRFFSYEMLVSEVRADIQAFTAEERARLDEEDRNRAALESLEEVLERQVIPREEREKLLAQLKEAMRLHAERKRKGA